MQHEKLAQLSPWAAQQEPLTQVEPAAHGHLMVLPHELT